MSSNRRTSSVVVPLLLSLVLVVAACGTATGTATGSTGQGGVHADQVANAGTLTFGAAFSAFNFNPWVSPNGDNESLDYLGAVYDSLTHVNPDGTVLPSLATHWTFVSPTTLSMTLRSGVTFSDGSPLDAAAVKANLDYAQHASPPGQLNPYLDGITTTVESPTSLRLQLPSPNPDLPFDFATGGGFIVNPRALSNPSRLASTPAGSGPYELSASGTVPNEQYTFVRRSAYWDLAQYPYNSVVLKLESSEQAAHDGLISGQLQVGVDSPQNASQDAAAGLHTQVSSLDGFSGVWIDRSASIVPALGSEKVRQALNYALDRPAAIKALYGSEGVPGSLVVPPGVIGYSKSAASRYTYDPAKARKLLDEAGYPHGFTLPLLSNPAIDTAAEAFAGYMSAIGVTVQIHDYTTSYVSQAESGHWAALFFAWTSVPPAQALTGLLSPHGFGNFNHSTDPEVESLLHTVGTTTGTAQAAALTNLVSAVNTKAWFVIPGYNETAVFTAKNVTCSVGQVPTCLLYTIRPLG